ncbi:hypothetical protein ScPMuIL_001717 [Solemya velum]
MEKTKDYLTVPGQETTCGTDQYTAFIELSNRCREFYRTRLHAAELAKQKINTENDTNSISDSSVTTDGGKKTSLDHAMDKLRKEMVSLMDQDLSLMKQLLTLNEAIEDLKFRRNNYYSRSSIQGSSCEFSESDWSVSGSDIHEHGLEPKWKYPASPRVSRQPRFGRHSGSGNIAEWPEDNLHHTRLNNLRYTHTGTLSSTPSTLDSKKPKEPEIIVNNTTERTGEQNSFDSGIDEPSAANESNV